MFTLLTLVPLALLLKGTFAASPAGYACKCAPSESCWPTAAQWAELNTTVNGNLIVNVPPPAACYQSFNGASSFDQTKCSEVTRMWGDEQWHTDQPATSLWTLWTNNTCNPPQGGGGFPGGGGGGGGGPSGPSSGSCTLGFQPQYVILAKTAAHIQAGVLFVKKYNIRLIVRNTGHDFMGRSTGWGSLAINTHSFKTIQFTANYSGPSEDSWTGGAVKLGSGVQTRELYKLAFAQSPKVVVVGGECPTVGISGGYVQGGGHGPMASRHGMGADNALAFEVVTTNGTLITADAATNPDLFWALRGGGPSTFGILVSVTLKTFPEVVTSGAFLDINTRDTTLFWKAVAAFHSRANDYVSKGMFVYYELFQGLFRVHPFTAPGMTKKELDAFLKPLWDDLTNQSIPFTQSSQEFPTFFELYTAMFEDEGAGASALTGGRIFSKDDIANNHPAIISAYKTITSGQTGGGIVGHIVGPGTGKPTVNNAINPVWRNASSFSIVTVFTTPDSKVQAQNVVTNVIGKALREAAPKGGAYVNEGDLEEPNWQTAYWGSNYPRLLELRQKWDPDGVLYARTTPGTENWEVIEGGTRLCKKVA